jgi:peptidoglycan/xylan/chitin deacetylase (PgdA/CDA1 family)
MKLLYVFFLLLLSYIPQDIQDPIDKTADLLKNGNVTELAKSFAPEVDLTILGNEDSYPAAKAAEILANFFRQNQPRSAKILHRIASNANYRFAVVLLTTSNGVYRVSYNLKNIGGQFEMNDIHIESEKQNNP